MVKLPFSVYDFFGYLASGVVVLTGFDLWVGPLILSEGSLGLYSSILMLLAAYVLGQITAQISKPILEDGFVHRLLLPPSRALMGEVQPVLPHIFRGYYKPLPPETQDRIRTRAKEQGLTTQTGETLFLHAYGVVTKNARAQDRLDSFRNQYGFARNMCLALLFCALTVTQAPDKITPDLPDHLSWLLLLFALTMLWRFLKFYRQYSYQLLLTYAEGVSD